MGAVYRGNSSQELTFSHGGDNQTDILEEKGKEDVKEWRRRVQMDLVKWMEEGPMAGGESSKLWRNILQQWNELNREDRNKWEETAWRLVTNGTEDDSLSSLLGWEDEEEEPMINITSMITVNNKTEERITMIPASSMEPFLHQMAPYAPILLLGVVPLFMILIPLLSAPFLITLLMVGIMVIVLCFASVASISALFLPFGMMFFALFDHVITWLDGEDVQDVIEKTGMEDLESLAATFTTIATTLSPLTTTLSPLTTTMAPLTEIPAVALDLAENSVVMTEIPRMFGW